MGGSIESLPADAIELGEPIAVLDPYAPLWSKSSRREGITLNLNPFPAVILGSPRGLRFHLSLGSIIGFAVFWLSGAMLWEAMAWASNPGNQLGIDIDLTAMPTDIFSSSAGIFGLVFAFAMTLSTLAFALGQGLGYGLTGRSMTDFGLALTGWAQSSNPALTSYRAIVPPITAALAQTAMGIGGLLILGGPGWSALQICFTLFVAFGALNLLVPISRRSSGSTFWRHLGRIAIGRGGRELDPQ